MEAVADGETRAARLVVAGRHRLVGHEEVVQPSRPRHAHFIGGVEDGKALVQKATRMVELLKSLAPDHAILLVEHDMDAVFAVADVITVMVNGQVLESGAPARIRASTAVQQAYLGEAPPEIFR